MLFLTTCSVSGEKGLAKMKEPTNFINEEYRHCSEEPHHIKVFFSYHKNINKTKHGNVEKSSFKNNHDHMHVLKKPDQIFVVVRHNIP